MWEAALEVEQRAVQTRCVAHSQDAPPPPVPASGTQLDCYFDCRQGFPHLREDPHQRREERILQMESRSPPRHGALVQVAMRL